MTDIKGYKPLSKKQKLIINSFKGLEGMVINRLENAEALEIEPDTRLLEIAREHIQIGFMAAVRAIAKPDDGALQDE